MARINDREYDWSMLEIKLSNVAGEPITGVTSVKYSRDRDVKANYGVGSNPVGRGYGNYEYKASITLNMKAAEQLRALSPDGNLMGLGEFDLIVSYLHPKQDNMVIHTIKNCIFSNDGVEANQGDTEITTEYDLNPLGMSFSDDAIV